MCWALGEPELLRTSFARVTMLSATLLSSLAFGSVVSIRSCSNSCETIVLCALPGQTTLEQTYANLNKLAH